MLLRLFICLVALTMPWLGGCGPSPVVGGTSGLLLAGGEPVADVQVTVYQPAEGDWQPIGFADTAADGTFRLLLNEARGPLQLVRGEYRFTLQSVGAPVVIPNDVKEVGTTSLRSAWTGEEPQLMLQLPKKLSQTRR